MKSGCLKTALAFSILAFAAGCSSNQVVSSTDNALNAVQNSENTADNSDISEYDGWTAWVGCYDATPSLMSRIIQPKSQKIRTRQKLTSGKMRIEIADMTGKILIEQTELTDAEYDLPNLDKIVVRLSSEAYQGCFDISLSEPDTDKLAKLHLYGEMHSVPKIMEKELEIWGNYYSQGMRDLFIEFPHYFAELFNAWMKSSDDAVLEQLFNDISGTAGGTSDVLNFFKDIKRRFPETVFHGTDVGHAYNVTGKRYFDMLKANNQENTENYKLTVENMRQGELYYKRNVFSCAFRENAMVNNFIREFEHAKTPVVMGIYGGAHVLLNNTIKYNDSDGCNISNMITMINWHYSTNIQSYDLREIVKSDAEYTEGTLDIAGKNYKTRYYGKQDISGFAPKYQYREFWLVEDAYDDFKDKPKLGNYLPSHNYPRQIDVGQVYVIDYTLKDGSVERGYYRSDGDMHNGMLNTHEFVVE